MTKASTVSSKATSRKQDPHWQALAGRETLIVFPGPHSYVSQPSLYEESLSRSYLNYIAIHAHGTLEIIEGEAEKESLPDRSDSGQRACLCRSMAR